MERIDIINKEIEELKEKLKNVTGTECEVYTRIVGYHRNIENWNKGKKAEYKVRKTFSISGEQIAANIKKQ
jgi:ribonucleoside-triphosphate reductase